MSSIIVPQGDGLISYIDALDIGEAAARCLLHPEAHHQQTYVLTGRLRRQGRRRRDRPSAQQTCDVHQHRRRAGARHDAPNGNASMVGRGWPSGVRARQGGWRGSGRSSSHPNPRTPRDEFVGIRGTQSRRVGSGHRGTRHLIERRLPHRRTGRQGRAHRFTGSRKNTIRGSAGRGGLQRWPDGLEGMGHASRPSELAPSGAACCLAACHSHADSTPCRVFPTPYGRLLARNRITSP